MKHLLTITLLLLSQLASSQTSGSVQYFAKIFAEQTMSGNDDGCGYMVQWTTSADGTQISNDQADLVAHVTTININADAISDDIKRITVFANNHEGISGLMTVNGSNVKVTGASSRAYAAAAPCDVVSVVGSQKECRAYLLPVQLSKGVTITVETVKGKFYSQEFTDPISAGDTKTLTMTTATANNLWMTTIPSNTYFSFVSIPGAHDSATSGVTGLTAAYSKCQGENIATLLANGVRAFDLRPNYKSSSTITADNLYIFHGTTNTNVLYVDAMKTIVDFIKANPSEAIVIVMVKEAGSGSKDLSSEMWTVLNSCHNSYSQYMKLLDHSYYTLKDFRGKICYINRTGTECTNTTRITNWPDNNNVTDFSAAIGSTCAANIQDKYNTSGNNKVTEIQTMLQQAGSNTDKSHFFFNFCSSAYRLGGSTPGKYAESTNPAITKYLNEGNLTGPAGYVYADYIGSTSNGGADLLAAIVDQNYRYVFKGMTGADTETNSNWDLSEGSDKAWTKTGTWADNKGTSVYVTENYAGWGSLEQTDFSLTRSVALPAGIYRVKAYGLYRDGVKGSARLIAKSTEKMYGSTAVAPMTTISSVGSNDLQKAANSFSGNNYLNTLYFVLSEPTVMTIGFEGTHTAIRQWFVAGPVELEKVEKFAENTDITSLITNPTIYNTQQGRCPDGWTCSNRIAGNGNYTTSTGDTQIENWHGNPSLAQFEYSQQITLPAGKYTLTADMLYNNGNADEVGIFVNDFATGESLGTACASVFDSKLHTVSLDFSTTGGETKIGVANMKTMSGDWFAADNFTLKYVGPYVETSVELLPADNMQNGSVTERIKKVGRIYNLGGVVLPSLQKGVNVVNGVKVLVK